MADRLTQLQGCLDQLNTQFYASLRYISLHHSASTLPSSDPTPAPQPEQQREKPNGERPPSQSRQPQSPPPPPAQQDPVDPQVYPVEQRPDSPITFAAAQQELAHDLILKTKQIEDLIAGLPGVGSTVAVQEKRIAELEVELKAKFDERRAAEAEKEKWARRVDDLICGIRR